MKQYTIELPDDVGHILEVRAAIDNQTVSEGIQNLLCHIVELWKVSKQC